MQPQNLRISALDCFSAFRNHDCMRTHVKEIRKARNMSQGDLSEITGLRVATISDLERGEGNPRLETLQKIADAFGLNVLDLFRSDGDEPTIFDLAHRISLLDPETRRAVETIVLNSLAARD